MKFKPPAVSAVVRFGALAMDAWWNAHPDLYVAAFVVLLFLAIWVASSAILETLFWIQDWHWNRRR
jgi:uncharacterized membrane protein HdeD (DUF308 family)